jgi:tRNA nucleotidyltransferase/poly(A) polymerase
MGVQAGVLGDPDQPAYTLRLTPAELKITHTALHSLLDGFGHEEREVGGVVRDVLNKLPSDSDMRTIDLSAELARRPRVA